MSKIVLLKKLHAFALERGLRVVTDKTGGLKIVNHP